MKNTKSVSRFLYVFALTLTVLAILSFPAPTEAYTCDPLTTWTTGYGSSTASCTAAQNNCYNNAYWNAYLNCQQINKALCYTGTFYNDGCFWVGGRYQMDCHLEYSCEFGPDGW